MFVSRIEKKAEALVKDSAEVPFVGLGVLLVSRMLVDMSVWAE